MAHFMIRFFLSNLFISGIIIILFENAYVEYGNTLINFAEKISLSPFPFASGLSGNMKQMKRRIINIASYKKPSFINRIKSTGAFILTAVLLLIFAPFISTYAADENHYQWNASFDKISNAKNLNSPDLTICYECLC